MSDYLHDPYLGHGPRRYIGIDEPGESAGEPEPEVRVMVDGRSYRLRIDAPNCGSQRHYHAEVHADGSPGDEPHHHHSARCDEIPRQATLIPAWEKTALRHDHDFGPDNRCACGAWREELPDTKRRRPGDPKPLKRVVGYHNLPDDNHPDGWSYERKEDREVGPS